MRRIPRWSYIVPVDRGFALWPRRYRRSIRGLPSSKRSLRMLRSICRRCTQIGRSSRGSPPCGRDQRGGRPGIQRWAGTIQLGIWSVTMHPRLGHGSRGLSLCRTLAPVGLVGTALTHDQVPRQTLLGIVPGRGLLARVGGVLIPPGWAALGP